MFDVDFYIAGLFYTGYTDHNVGPWNAGDGWTAGYEYGDEGGGGSGGGGGYLGMMDNTVHEYQSSFLGFLGVPDGDGFGFVADDDV